MKNQKIIDSLKTQLISEGFDLSNQTDTTAFVSSKNIELIFLSLKQTLS